MENKTHKNHSFVRFTVWLLGFYLWNGTFRWFKDIFQKITTEWPNFRKKVAPALNNIRKDPPVRFRLHVNATSFTFRRFLRSFSSLPRSLLPVLIISFQKVSDNCQTSPTQASAHASDRDRSIQRWSTDPTSLLSSRNIHCSWGSCIFFPTIVVSNRICTHTYWRANPHTAAAGLTPKHRRQPSGWRNNRLLEVCWYASAENMRFRGPLFSLRFSHAHTCTLSEKAPRPSFGVLFSCLSHYIGFHDGDLVKAPLQKLEPSGSGWS